MVQLLQKAYGFSEQTNYYLALVATKISVYSQVDFLNTCNQRWCDHKLLGGLIMASGSGWLTNLGICRHCTFGCQHVNRFELVIALVHMRAGGRPTMNNRRLDPEARSELAGMAHSAGRPESGRSVEPIFAPTSRSLCRSLGCTCATILLHSIPAYHNGGV